MTDKFEKKVVFYGSSSALPSLSYLSVLLMIITVGLWCAVTFIICGSSLAL